MTTLPVVLKDGYGEGGRGGAGTTPTARHRPLQEVMNAVQLDLAALRGAAIASADGVVAAGAAPTKAEYDVVVALVNELKAALNVRNETPTSPAVTGGNAETYDLSGSKVLTLDVDGASRTFTFADGDFAAPAAATAAEAAAAINSRNGLAEFGVRADDNGGSLRLTGLAGGDRTLATFAGSAETVLDFAGGVAVVGAGHVLNLQQVAG